MQEAATGTGKMEHKAFWSRGEAKPCVQFCVLSMLQEMEDAQIERQRREMKKESCFGVKVDVKTVASGDK